jgi:hypothetical protein
MQSVEYSRQQMSGAAGKRKLTAQEEGRKVAKSFRASCASNSFKVKQQAKAAVTFCLGLRGSIEETDGDLAAFNLWYTTDYNSNPTSREGWQSLLEEAVYHREMLRKSPTGSKGTGAAAGAASKGPEKAPVKAAVGSAEAESRKRQLMDRIEGLRKRGIRYFKRHPTAVSTLDALEETVLKNGGVDGLLMWSTTVAMEDLARQFVGK